MNIEYNNKVQNEDLKFLIDALALHDNKYFDNSTKTDVSLFLRDTNKEIQAGLVGGILYETLYVNYFWVNKSLRGTGFGKKIFQRLEEEAKKKVLKLFI